MTKEEVKVVETKKEEKEHNCNCGTQCHHDCHVNKYNQKLINVLMFLTIINMILLSTSIIFVITNINDNCNTNVVEKNETEKEDNNAESKTEEVKTDETPTTDETPVETPAETPVETPVTNS